MLLDHIVNGYRAMPPLGQCIECTEDDLKTLMRFMSSPAADNEKKN
jgi:cytochrome c5